MRRIQKMAARLATVTALLLGLFSGCWSFSLVPGTTLSNPPALLCKVRCRRPPLGSTPLKDVALNNDLFEEHNKLLAMNATGDFVIGSSTLDVGNSIAVIDEKEGKSSSSVDLISLWKKRLITHEDPLSIHKLSSLIYTISSAVILGVGALRFLDNEASFAVIPDFLQPLSYLFVVSNAIMCVASVRMSFLHRRGDLTARNAFLGTAVSSLFSGFFFLWVSPFAPDAFNSDLVNQGCFAVLCLLNAYFIADTLNSIPEVVEGRRDRKAEDYQGRFIVDALGYVLPIAWGLPVIGATGYQASVLHDRLWFLDACAFIEQSTGVAFQSNVYYLQILASMAASFGALFVTLRDKKLISKNTEVLGITLFSVPAMIWTIYVTVIFYRFH